MVVIGGGDVSYEQSAPVMPEGDPPVQAFLFLVDDLHMPRREMYGAQPMRWTGLAPWEFDFPFPAPGVPVLDRRSEHAAKETYGTQPPSSSSTRSSTPRSSSP